MKRVHPPGGDGCGPHCVLCREPPPSPAFIGVEESARRQAAYAATRPKYPVGRGAHE